MVKKRKIDYDFHKEVRISVDKDTIYLELINEPSLVLVIPWTKQWMMENRNKH